MKWMSVPAISFAFAIVGGSPVSAQQTAWRWSGYNQGVKWESSLVAAQKRAQKEHKMIFYFQMVGDMDMEGS